MNTFTVIMGSLVVAGAIFTFGYSQGKDSVRVEQFEAYTVLSDRMSKADTIIATLQTEIAAERDKEVVKYVTVYRDRVKDPIIANAVRDSGLLSVYDSTVSTTIK